MSTPKKFFSNDNPFLLPHEVVRPAPDGQIAAITTYSTPSYLKRNSGSGNILIVYQFSRSYVQYMHAKNFYSSDYYFLSPPEVVRPACDGQIAAQLRAIRSSHTGKRSEQGEIF